MIKYQQLPELVKMAKFASLVVSLIMVFAVFIRCETNADYGVPDGEVEVQGSADAALGPDEDVEQDVTRFNRATTKSPVS